MEAPGVTAPWVPVVVVDIVGSVLTLVIALFCAVNSWKWVQKRPGDIFRQYIMLLTLSIVFFAISRSFGHLVKQVLIIADMADVWKSIAPFSGAVNTTAFVVIFAFGVYFHRFKKVHEEVEVYRNNLEQLVDERTEELGKTQATLENIFNSAIPICINSLDFDVLQANDAYYAIWPKPEDPAAPVKCYETRPGSLCRTEGCPVMLIGAGQEEVINETRKTDGRGGEKYFIVTARPFRNADGKLVGILESFQDITDRKQAEKELEAEKERLAVTLRSIGDGVITTDTAGIIVLMNKVSESLTGWSQEEAMGRPLEEVLHLIHQTSRQPCDNPAEKVLATGKTIELESRTVLVSRGGEERLIADSAAPIRDRRSLIIGVVMVFRDVSEKILMEEKLLKVRKLESVGILAGGIAHDFNNILVAILGNISMAIELLNPEEKSRSLLLDAEKASLRAKDLTRQLLTFAKGGEPVKETASVAEIIRDSADFSVHGSKVVCRYEIPDDLRYADIDRGQMSQVIQNLVLNARQAMPEGGAIDIRCENVSADNLKGVPLPRGEYVKISIADGGVGIPEENLERVFDPFFSTKKDGSGLGLSVTHSIIEKHGGHISVTSRLGVGTSFQIFLPAESAGRPAGGEKPPPPLKLQGKGRILIMDDEEIVRDVARGMLTLLGYEVIETADGEEALEAYRHSRVEGRPLDLVIMDLTIPGGMGGKEAVQKLLALDPDAKVIVSSGYSNDPIMANFRKYGFRGAVLKPYRIAEMGAAVQKLLAE